MTRVENCRRAMQLAKDHLNVPRVITPEDFASEELDELSAMTYLSYFIKKDSPGYYAMLNWVCRQIKTTNVSNLTVSRPCATEISVWRLCQLSLVCKQTMCDSYR